jgi:hypothetical protein
MVTAFLGHSLAQMPHPLQKSKLGAKYAFTSIMHWTGQYSAQLPQ